MLRAGALLLLLAAALPAALAQTTTKIGVVNIAPFATKGADGKLTGFDVAVAENACKLAGLQCELVLLDSLTDRIPKLLDGTVDALVATLTVTDERRKQVLFVAPNYYASGVSLFALKDKAAGLASWEAVKGAKLCAPAGFYLNDELKSTYGAELVEAADSAAQLDKLIAGDCAAAVTDTADLSLIINGAAKGATVVFTDAPALDVAPYGAAVRPDDEALAVKLSGAIAQGMLSAGANSTIFDLEDEYVISAGGEPAAFLPELADAVTYMVPQEE